MGGENRSPIRTNNHAIQPNLPPDHFERARLTTPGFQSDLAIDVAVDDSHREPIRLEGVTIHTVAEGTVHDIAVDSRHGRFKLWLFLRVRNPQRKPKKAGMDVGWSSSRNLSLHHPWPSVSYPWDCCWDFASARSGSAVSIQGIASHRFSRHALRIWIVTCIS